MDHSELQRVIYINSGANSGLQSIALFIVLLTTGANVFVTCSNVWMTNDIEGLVLESIRRTGGLFYKCTSEGNGKQACEDYDQFFVGLPTAFIIGRILMVSSVILSTFSLILGMLGASCTSFVTYANPSSQYLYEAIASKHHVGKAAGVIQIMASSFVILSVSFCLAMVVNDYLLITNLGQQVQLFIGARTIVGHAIWVGLVSGVIGFIGGLLLLCGSFSSQPEMESSKHLIDRRELGPVHGKQQSGMSDLDSVFV